MKRTVGVLQNPWFKPGILERHVKMFRENPDFRRRVIAMSVTGKRLIKGLGEGLYSQIHWTDASMEHGHESGHLAKPDLKWLASEVDGADVVVAFGKVAVQAVWTLTQNGMDYFHRPQNFQFLGCCHPTARGKNDFAQRIAEIRAILEQ